MRRRWLAGLLVLAACTSETSGGHGRSAGPPTTGDSDTLTYGYGPIAGGTTAEYQPDVVLVKAGPQAIRSASSDGLTWTLDPAAEGVSDLAVGKIAFVTSRAIGRVAALDRSGAGVAVTLLPVQLEDVFRTLHLRVDRPISLDELVFQEVPDQLGTLDTKAGDIVNASAAPEPPKFLDFTADEGPLPPARKISRKVAIGPVEIEPYASTGQLGIRVAYKQTLITNSDKSTSVGIKGGIDIGMRVRNLRLITSVDIVDSHPANGEGGLTIAMAGIEQMLVDIAVGLGEGQNDTRRYRIEIPLEINLPIPPAQTGGIPLTVQFKWKWLGQLAFSAKNSTLSTRAAYKLSGPIGIIGGKASVPTLTQTNEGLIKGTQGVSVGISAVIFGFELRAMLGLGTPAFMAGPYAKVVASLSLLRGSDTTAPWGVCVQGTLDVLVGAGVGLQMSPQALSLLKGRFKQDVKIEYENEKLWPVTHLSGYKPNVGMCRI